MSTDRSSWPGEDWARAWLDRLLPGRWAPGVLTQPILPGWSFGPTLTINEANSSSPRTEEAILETHSYGRQLGRMAGALDAVIDHVDPDDADPRIEAFREMQREIADVKQRTSDDDVDRARTLLGWLRETNRPAFDGLMTEFADGRPG
ncbi:hypothetical protein LQ327_25775 [Actinomycetospora endophytica]|uniref:Uncharacterized protein n=1 Tax=Actinomycetospora endophytica TaxID=2291215 RepID=A0ABS8PES5_9PSEU|nr:hypothetical protein [Actinomycetospora endophytica]MCD2196785.1 hypothetical protein [Actinomycetospora endophytica]